MTIEYTGVGGVQKKYNAASNAEVGSIGSKVTSYGNRTVVEYNFDYTNLPAWSATNLNDAGIPVIPAYSVIESAYLLVTTIWAGGTALEVGTFQAVAGTAVDADGIIPAAVGALTNINAAGEGLIGTGAQVLNVPTGAAATGLIAATNTTGAVDTVIGVVATGTFTAGAAKLIVTYIRRDA